MSTRAVVIGLGDYVSGDFGVGGYVPEALRQERLRPRVRCHFLGLEAWKTGLYVLDCDRAFIVHGICSGQHPGTLRLLDLPAYQKLQAHAALDPAMGFAVLDSLAKIALLAPAPKLQFVLIEMQSTAGLCLNLPVRLAVRKAVQAICHSLLRDGHRRRVPENVSRLYHLELLSLAV